MHACIQSSATIAEKNYYTVGAIKNFRYYDDESERIAHQQQEDSKSSSKDDHKNLPEEEEEEEEHRLAQNQGVLCGLLLLNLFLLLVLYLAIETSGPMTRWRQRTTKGTTTTSSSSINNNNSFLERFLNEELITDDSSSSSSYLFRLSVLRLAALVGLLLETPFFIAFCSLKNDKKEGSSSPTLQILLLTAHALLLTGAVIATAQATVRLHLWPFWAAEVLLAVLVDVTSLAMVVDLVHQVNGGGKKRIGRGRGEQKLSSCGIQLRRSGRKVNEVARRCGCCLVKRCTESVVRI